MRRMNLDQYLKDLALRLRLLYANPQRSVYDDPPDPTEEETDPDPDPEDPPVVPPKKKGKETKVEFTPEQQEFMNAKLAEERRKGQEIVRKKIVELETLKTKAGTTAAEKATLEQRIEDLKGTQLTEKETLIKEKKKSEAKLTTERDDAIKKADFWKTKYTDSTLRRSITDEAVKQKASPRHIVNELLPMSYLEEDVDDEGKPLGSETPKARITTQSKEGKTVVMNMTITEAVKFLSEQEEHAPLFDSGAKGGVGGTSKGRGGKASDPNSPPSDPDEYREWRKKHLK